MFDLSGKAAVVTGGSRGWAGRFLALARAGADVVVRDILSSPTRLQRVAEASQSALAQLFTSHNMLRGAYPRRIRAMGRRSMALKIDVTDRDQVAAAFAQASVSPSRGPAAAGREPVPHGQPGLSPTPRGRVEGHPSTARDPSRLLRDAAAARPSAPRTVGPPQPPGSGRNPDIGVSRPDIGDQ